VKINPFSRKSKLESKIEKKSFSYNDTASVYLDNQGNIIDTVYSNNEDSIRVNGSINTILSKQNSIISESVLTIKEKEDDQDKETTNKDALQFLKWLETPNSYPAPTNRNEIVQYMFDENFKAGISGIIFNFDGDIGINNWENIKLAQTIALRQGVVRVSYEVSVDQYKAKIFEMDERWPGLFINEFDSKISVLFVSGYYDIKKAVYKSPFEKQIQYINLQNHLINFSSSFYQNACFPSQIVQLTYKHMSPDNQTMSPENMRQFKEAVRQVKHQIEQSKSSKNAGKNIVPEHPSLEIEIKPLSMSTGVKDSTEYDNWATTKIFGFVDGGSKSAFDGENEYSNNAIVKLEDLYDGTFRIFNSAIVTKLNTFMISLFTVMRVPVDLQNIYLSVDTTGIKLYQKQAKVEVRELVKENIITINEGRKKLGEITESYADLQDLNQGSSLIIEYGKKTVNPTQGEK
jgi:hypothetical protein